jgi:hypothetical protein
MSPGPITRGVNLAVTLVHASKHFYRRRCLCHLSCEAKKRQQYHNKVQEMQAKSDDLVRKNKSLRQKNKGMSPAKLLSTDWGTLL